MSILFRNQYQQAAQINRRLQFLFWFGVLGAHLVYWLVFALLFLAGIHLYNLGVLPDARIDPNTVHIFRYAFCVALIPTLIVLMAYQEQRFLFRSRKAVEFGRSLGAKSLDIKNKSHYRFQQLVEEMSIASGVRAPELLVFPRDESINAFLLAGGKHSLALGVSQGALEHLDRNELQAIIAHQFGHLKDGYLPIFSHLAAMTAAYSAIVNYCTHAAIPSAALERNLFPNPLRELATETGIGEFLALFGRIFHQYGLWLQATFSRQRIRMADARAVQFTRYPDTLQTALKKALVLQSKGVRKVFPPRHFAHVFFHHEQRTLFAAQQTHPSLKERIMSLGGTLLDEEEEALLFEMEEAARENSAIDPSERYRSLFNNATLLYPLLSLNRLTQNHTKPSDASSVLLAYFLYHSGATIFDLQQQNILTNQRLSSIRQALMSIELTPPLEQLALLPQLSQEIVQREKNLSKINEDFDKLVRLNGQVSEFEACGLMFWRVAMKRENKQQALHDCQRDIAMLFSVLIVQNKVHTDQYDCLIRQVFPQQYPPFSLSSNNKSEQLLELCQIVERLSNLSSSNKRLLAVVINNFYQQQRKIPLGQAYLRYTLLSLFKS